MATNGIPAVNQVTTQHSIAEHNLERSSKKAATTAARTDSDLARIVQHFQAEIGEFPRSALDKLQRYREAFSTELICKAIDEAAENGVRKWRYVDGILKGWQNRWCAHSGECGSPPGSPEEAGTAAGTEDGGTDLNIHKVLLGALLIKPDLAAYALPDLEIEHFPADLQPVFAALSGLWNTKGELDAVAACARYPEQKAAILECVQECESECVRLTRDRVEEWTRLVLEQSALTRFQELSIQAASSLTTFADLPDLYSRMGEALTLDREEQDFVPIGKLVDTYIRKLDEKPQYIPSGIPVLDKHLHLAPGNLFIIGGRPSAGKTALSLQMACEMARNGYKVCYFSLETDPDTLTARIIANRLAIPLSDVKAKTVPQSSLDDLAELHRLPLFIRSASGKGAGWIKAQAQRMKAQVVLSIIYSY